MEELYDFWFNNREEHIGEDNYGEKYYGYEIFKNDRVDFLKKYKPANQIIKQTANQFKQIAKQQNIILNDETAEKLVDRVISTAELEKGFKLQSPSDV